MRQFYAPTEDFIKSAKSYVESDANAGVSKITVKNSHGFKAGKYICLGREGNETSELRRIASITGDEITLAAVTAQPHYSGANVTQYAYDQRKLYYREDSDGDWTHASSDSPVDIAVDSPKGTLLEHTDGTADYEYIATYFDSNGSIETSTDDAKVAGTVATSTNLCSLQQIRNAAGWQDNIYVTDAMLGQARSDAQGEIFSALRKVYTFPLTRNSSYLSRIAVDMAVGFLFIDEYGMDVQNVAKDGYRRIEDSRERLMKLSTKEYMLYDEDEDTDQGVSQVDTPSYYPDDSTEDEEDDRVFSMGMKF
jgi:phage gp36-like protein